MNHPHYNPFKKLCKHAIQELSRKTWYGQLEYDQSGGKCWWCGGDLKAEERRKETIDSVNMPEDQRKEIRNDSKKVEHLLRHVNQQMYRCVPCFKAAVEKGSKGPFTPLKDIIDDIKNPNGKWRQDDLERIQEVEECGEDCPWWDRLPCWRERVADKTDYRKELK